MPPPLLYCFFKAPCKAKLLEKYSTYTKHYSKNPEIESLINEFMKGSCLNDSNKSNSIPTEISINKTRHLKFSNSTFLDQRARALYSTYEGVLKTNNSHRNLINLFNK